ncbi:phosphoribosylaminoimidazole carboxylase, ATPase subunit [Elsinoe australis]|uniref:Pectate lyase n=1 Tax=Elsinoe australis TaxID=40998 RepID=A0A2P7YVP6_9PEZI|nr:phosphoribosylaminoimidazole carboxylase, ATPase subunit [Elsinoe australis]
MQFLSTLALFGAVAMANPEGIVAGHSRIARDVSFNIPASKGTVDYTAPQKVSGVFDGGMKTYGRKGVKCDGQSEGGQADTVFLISAGGTLQNAIIGANQKEGVYCLGACTIKNVWWTAVCEDALSIKGNGNALVSGGGARAAEDKVIQHNGFGTVTIDGFKVVNFGKLYRSCGNCKENGKARSVVVKNVQASSGKTLVGINSNYGDKATITGTCATGVKKICSQFTGNNNGKEPKEVSSGPGGACGSFTVAAC